MSDLNKKCRFRLTYPLHGNKIYETMSLNKAVKKCYHEFKQLSDINEGKFTVTNLDTKKDYHFDIPNDKLKNIAMSENTMIGGYTESDLLTKINKMEEKINYLEERLNSKKLPQITENKDNIDNGSYCIIQ